MGKKKEKKKLIPLVASSVLREMQKATGKMRGKTKWEGP